MECTSTICTYLPIVPLSPSVIVCSKIPDTETINTCIVLQYVSTRFTHGQVSTSEEAPGPRDGPYAVEETPSRHARVALVGVAFRSMPHHVRPLYSHLLIEMEPSEGGIAKKKSNKRRKKKSNPDKSENLPPGGNDQSLDQLPLVERPGNEATDGPTSPRSSGVTMKSKTSKLDAQTVGAMSACTLGAEVNTSSVSTFQRELEWCIAQLERSISRSNASKAQKQETNKFIRILRSEKTVLPRKRQLMKNLFGDYRARMTCEPLPERYRPPTSPSISSVGDKASLENAGKFFKKSASQIHKDSEATGLEGDCFSKVHVGSELPEMFRFNFNVEL